jgi:putative salt-induced outer membrane protein YdiY
MWKKTLCALLLAAGLARAETIEQAVRGYLADAAEVPAAQTHPWDEGGLLAAAADATTPWDISGALGLTLTDGNSDTVSFTAGADAKREWPKWKLGMKIAILYGETEGVQTSSEWIFLERLERKLSEVATIFQDLLLEHDEEEDLRYRVQLTAGYNRRLKKTTDFELWGNVGGGVLFEEFFNDSETEAILQAGINFTWQLTKHLTYVQIITFYPSLSEGGEFRFYWESTLTTPIGERFDLRLSIIDRYDSNPQAGVEENDLTIVLSLVIRFTKAPPK